MTIAEICQLSDEVCTEEILNQEAVAYMEARDLERAAKHLQAFSETMGRLELVPRGF